MPTIRRCCIVGCKSNSRVTPSLQFFQFPRPESQYHILWKQACYASLSRILPFKKPVVCAMHFRPNCIGGRRLTASAVPTLRLEVTSNVRAEEEHAMIDDLERSRKCAYINAVVYEWLVRANLNPQLRGSITHGMIKEKAETTKGIIGCESFVADNRWLNRFRETHLGGFAQKLATNQLKPLGMSLWINDIVKDLEHLFPPPTSDVFNALENVPEQYMDYMPQYGEYEEEDDDLTKSHTSYQDHEQQNQLNYDIYDQHSQMECKQEDDSYNEGKTPVNSQRTSPNNLKRKRQQENDDTDTNGNSMSDDFAEVYNVHSRSSYHSNDSSQKQIKASNVKSMKTDSEKNNNNNESKANNNAIEITSYLEALEHLKPLEEFVLLRENFRAIGLISQLEMILQKGDCIATNGKN